MNYMMNWQRYQVKYEGNKDFKKCRTLLYTR